MKLFVPVETSSDDSAICYVLPLQFCELSTDLSPLDNGCKCNRPLHVLCRHYTFFVVSAVDQCIC